MQSCKKKYVTKTSIDISWDN